MGAVLAHVNVQCNHNAYYSLKMIVPKQKNENDEFGSQYSFVHSTGWFSHLFFSLPHGNHTHPNIVHRQVSLLCIVFIWVQFDIDLLVAGFCYLRFCSIHNP